jgi:hypothetical protein
MRLRHKHEDNIKIDLKEIEYESAEWIYLARSRNYWILLMSMIANIRIRL